MPGIRELRKTLVRGARVRVRDTPKKALLHDQRVYVKSEALAPCRGEHRCAKDRKCNGFAVFVCPEDPSTIEGGAGWRKGASKLCLSHLNDDDGANLTRSLSVPTKSEKPVNRNEDADIQFEAALIAENRRLKDRLIELQERLIAALEGRNSPETEEEFSAFGPSIFDPILGDYDEIVGTTRDCSLI